MDMREVIKTDEIVIRDAALSDCARLQQIGATWEEQELIEGEKFNPQYIIDCLTHGDLPPVEGASIDKYALKAICLKNQNDNIIGYFDLYHGYPSEDVLWISIFLIDKNYRRNGYARKVMESLSCFASKNGITKIGIGVNLKNWSALKFWISIGFNTIKGLYGDSQFSPDNHALINLEKSL